MKYYNVSFQYNETIYCTNIAKTDDPEKIKAHYSKYTWYNISEATAGEVETARRKGMPIIEL